MAKRISNNIRRLRFDNNEMTQQMLADICWVISLLSKRKRRMLLLKKINIHRL